MVEVVGIICGTVFALAGLVAILVVIAATKAKQISDQVFDEARKIISDVEAGK